MRAPTKTMLPRACSPLSTNWPAQFRRGVLDVLPCPVCVICSLWTRRCPASTIRSLWTWRCPATVCSLRTSSAIRSLGPRRPSPRSTHLIIRRHRSGTRGPHGRRPSRIICHAWRRAHPSSTSHLRHGNHLAARSPLRRSSVFVEGVGHGPAVRVIVGAITRIVAVRLVGVHVREGRDGIRIVAAAAVVVRIDRGRTGE